MQTFLPYSDFYTSLACLDKKRKFKQVVEAVQILNTLEGRSEGWKNHPAVKMWKGYENALREYQCIGFDLCISMGYQIKKLVPMIPLNKVVYPPWLGLDIFHNSHQSNLLRKKPEYYSKFNWTVVDCLPYYWPK